MPHPVCEIGIGRVTVLALVDTGATVNNMSEQQKERLCPKPRLHPRKGKIHPYGNGVPLWA